MAASPTPKANAQPPADPGSAASSSAALAKGAQPPAAKAPTPKAKGSMWPKVKTAAHVDTAMEDAELNAKRKQRDQFQNEATAARRARTKREAAEEMECEEFNDHHL